jgi:hypothetical protein
VVQKDPTIAGEQGTFATTMGPQEGLTDAKVELLDRPATPRERLTTTLARLSSQGIQEVLAVVVAEEKAVVGRHGRPAALDELGCKKVCLLLTLGYTRALAAAELGINRSTITRTMQRDPDFRQAVFQAEELFERTPLLTIFDAAQRNWRAAAWLMKNYRPHQSVNRRKAARDNRAFGRSTREFFDSVMPKEPRTEITPERKRKTGGKDRQGGA